MAEKKPVLMAWKIALVSLGFPWWLTGNGILEVIRRNPLHPDVLVLLGALGLVGVGLIAQWKYGRLWSPRVRRRQPRYQRWLWGLYSGSLVAGLLLVWLAGCPPEWLLSLLGLVK